jgi:hypothetical protein
MNQTFTEAMPDTQLSILEFLKEEKMSIFFHFKKKGYEYLKSKYLEIYKHILLGADGKIHLIAFLTSLDRISKMIKLVVLEYCTGDAEAVYDDSSVSKLICPSYPDGIELDVPLDAIRGIAPFRTVQLPK